MELISVLSNTTIPQQKSGTSNTNKTVKADRNNISNQT